ncbi:hypothetical protein [Cohnella sp.]|uniref:hypothetical protein n=1 Tax=Cohnella sp. TaxID=1883426 RepID=UPI003564E72A
MNKWRALWLLVVWVLVLTGCQSSLEPVTETALEKQYGEEVSADFNQEDEAVVDAGDGNVEIDSKVEIPADFPGEFPQPEGELSSAIKAENGWQLIYIVTDQEKIVELAEWFPNNGYTKEMATEISEMKTWIFENERYMVTLGLVLSEHEHTFSYMVSIK